MKGARRLSALFFFPAALSLGPQAFADNDSNAVVNSAFADAALTTLTLRGANLTGKKPRAVYLSGFASPLAITSATSTQIVAQLPAGVTPGSYFVTVRAGGGDGEDIPVTFGATGSQGPKGDKGDKGDPGACGCDGSTLYANSASTGSTGPTLTVAESGPFTLSAKFVLIADGGIPAVSFHCHLAQLGPYVVLDEARVSVGIPAGAPGFATVVMQAPVNITTPSAQFQVDCARDDRSGIPTGFSYDFSKMQALRVHQLISPSP